MLRKSVTYFIILSVCCQPMCLSNYPKDNGNWALGILLVGVLTQFEAARVSRATAQALPASFDTVQFETEDFDTNNLYNPATPDHIRIGSGGFYFVSAGADFQDNGIGRRIAQIQGNANLLRNVGRAAAGAPTANHLAMIQQFTAGTMVKLRVFQNSGAVLNTTTDPTTNLSVTVLDRAVVSAAVVTKTTAQSIASAVPTAINFEAAEYDTGGYFNLAQPDRLTAPTTGLYLIGANTAFQTPGPGARGVELFLNAATSIVRDIRLAPPGAPTFQGVSTVYQLTAGDTISARAFQTSGAALNLDTPARLFIARLDSPVISDRSVLFRTLATGVADLATSVDTGLELTNVFRADAAYAITDSTTTTIQESGLYLCVANAQLSAVAGSQRRMTLLVNGAGVQSTTKVGVNLGEATLNLIHLRQLNAGDTIQLQANQNTGAALSWITNRSFLQIIKMD